ncbi:hypothetical protein Tco_0981251 [Tanacetum coccineum]
MVATAMRWCSDGDGFIDGGAAFGGCHDGDCWHGCRWWRWIWFDADKYMLVLAWMGRCVDIEGLKLGEQFTFDKE